MEDIKDYRERELPLFVIANVLTFLIVHRFIKIDVSDLPGSFEVLSDIFVSAVLAVVAFGFILMVECLFTSHFKERLVYLFGFWGLLSLPGCTIFSVVKKKCTDNRYTYEKFEMKYRSIYEDLPSDPRARKRYENEKWYEIYAKHRNARMILLSQRDSLLCRDVYVSVLVMIAIYIIIVALQVVGFHWKYFLFLTVMSVVSNIGANRNAVRLVYNVIAYDLNAPRGNKEDKE